MSKTLQTRATQIATAEPGLDGHDRTVEVLAQCQRDAGLEVVYPGIFQTPSWALRAIRGEAPRPSLRCFPKPAPDCLDVARSARHFDPFRTWE